MVESKKDTPSLTTNKELLGRWRMEAVRIATQLQIPVHTRTELERQFINYYQNHSNSSSSSSTMSVKNITEPTQFYTHVLRFVPYDWEFLDRRIEDED